MNQIFVCFTHGVALPILFPICAVGIFNLYFCERIQFAYFYRQPPMFDNSLNEKALHIMSYGPVVFLAFAYW